MQPNVVTEIAEPDVRASDVGLGKDAAVRPEHGLDDDFRPGRQLLRR